MMFLTSRRELRLPASAVRCLYSSCIRAKAQHGSCYAAQFSTRARARDYEDALSLLDSLQSNRATVSSLSGKGSDPNKDAIPEMIDWAQKAGYSPSDFTKAGLRCVHVAGTKGKGSVCNMVQNILAQYQKNQSTGTEVGKIGVFTSPHLVTVRERIQINGSPISEAMFTHYFFELWDRLSRSAASASIPNAESPENMPFYFRYLTLLAFHTFIQEGVKSAVVECGIGGEYDSTNILPPEAVTVSAITRLGIDHPGLLGNTIESIAWHKAGIMKPGVPVFAMKQSSEAERVLTERAKEKKVKSLNIVPRRDDIDSGEVSLGLLGDFQKDNASLAVEVAKEYMSAIGAVERADNIPLDPEIREGLKKASLPGRCQILEDGNVTWHVDGAHTIDSLQETGKWFGSRVLGRTKVTDPLSATMLVFNQQDREPKPLLNALLKHVQAALPVTDDSTLRGFTYAAFCTNEPFKSQLPDEVDLTVQKDASRAFSVEAGNMNHRVYGSVEETIDYARKVGQKEKLSVLVTGSMHLAGAFLKVISEKGTAA